MGKKKKQFVRALLHWCLVHYLTAPCNSVSLYIVGILLCYWDAMVTTNTLFKTPIIS